MEADWEFEIGPDAPVIESYWNGFVDLRAQPERAWELSECRELPALADILVSLNAVSSPVWTCKMDVFTPEHIDPDEMNASEEDAAHSIACYIDLLQRNDQTWEVPLEAESDCRNLREKLRAILLGNCRVDIVLRRAVLGDVDKLGATVYITACGSTLENAKSRLAECMAAFAVVVVSG
jgi:hypothetical protein